MRRNLGRTLQDLPEVQDTEARIKLKNKLPDESQGVLLCLKTFTGRKIKIVQKLPAR